MSHSKLHIEPSEQSINRILDLMTQLASDLNESNSKNFKSIANQVFADLSQLLEFDTISIFDYQIKDHSFKRSYFFSNLDIYEVKSKYEFPELLILDKEKLKLNHINDLNENHLLFPIFDETTTKALFVEPLMNNEICFGFLSFEQHTSLKTWSAFEINIFRILGQIISQTFLKTELIKEIADLKEEAILANQAKGELLFKMSHEIRTPLSGIYNSIYLLGTTNLSVEQKDFLEIGQASADIMTSVVDGILDISKIESGLMEVFNDSFNLEEELIRLYLFQKKIANDKGLNLDFNFDYRINFELKGDYKKLRQIIFNLLSNAIKYTYEGSISLNVNLESEEDYSNIKFEIIDTGIGFDEKNVHHLNEIFSMKSDLDLTTFQSSGLGIAITNQLVQLLGGHIEVESHMNQGSTFSVYLKFEKGQLYKYPFKNQQSALVILDQNSQSRVKNLIQSLDILVYTSENIGKERCDWIIVEKEIKNEKYLQECKDNYGMKHTHVISFYQDEQKKFQSIDLYSEFPVSRHSLYQKMINLEQNEIEEQSTETTYQTILSGLALIVDDNRLNRIALESILHKEGLKSKSVNNGPKAIEAVQKDTFDIILMDVQMPDMDGIETTRRIRSLGDKYKNIPIIAVTANAFLSDYDFMKTSQMNDIILKPIRFKNLNQILRKYIKNSSSIVIPAELFIFDKKDFDLRFEGSFDIAEEIMESFIESYQKDLDKIEEAINSKNGKQIIEAAHYFKGSCAYLSAKRSVWILNYILSAAKNENYEYMNRSYELLKKEIEDLLKAIKIYRK